MEFAGVSAIVTGGAGGLGAAVVARFTALGASVVLVDRDERRSLEVAEAVGGTGAVGGAAVGSDPGTVSVVVGDALDDETVHEAIDAARSLGRLSVLVNLAGGAVGGGSTVRGDATPHSQGSFVDTLMLNVAGTFNVARLVAAAMAHDAGAASAEGAGAASADGTEVPERGVIINTASIAAFEGQRGQVAYAAAKAAIVGMTLPMARDLAPFGIRVCTIAPGPMATPVMERVLDKLEVDPAKGVVFPKRMGDPAEFALAVEMIVRNPYLNGETIRLDAALRLAGG
ncbi:MAG: SDR family NAD(P)-dependent oxidoreductase [Microthrixaceae bacterium]|nr:SDR family NAD(P)-dependent oxidoreductase [Microthrixaceae bacterium]